MHSLKLVLSWFLKGPWATRASDPEPQRDMNYLTTCSKRCQGSGKPEEATARDYSPTERPSSPLQSPTLGSSNGPEVEHISCQADSWEPLPSLSLRTPPGPRLPGAGVCVTGPLGSHVPSWRSLARRARRRDPLTLAGRKTGGVKTESGTSRRSLGRSLLHGFRGPSRPSSLHVSGILCPAAGS